MPVNCCVSLRSISGFVNANCASYWSHVHWNGTVILTEYLSLAVLEIDTEMEMSFRQNFDHQLRWELRIFSEASDEKFVKKTFLFQWFVKDAVAEIKHIAYQDQQSNLCQLVWFNWGEVWSANFLRFLNIHELHDHDWRITILTHCGLPTPYDNIDLCLTAPSHCVNQCWLIIKGVLWYTPECNFTRNAHEL